MNLLYWNLHANSRIETIIADCVFENDIDVAIFSEYDSIDFSKLNGFLLSKYDLLESFGGCEKVKLIHKKSIQISLIQEQHRYILAKLQRKNKTYLLVGLHLPSNTFGDGSSNRKNIIRKIVNDIVDIENNSIHSCLVIGDMNASPFDAEMIEKDAFNAVLFKKIIKQQETVIYQEDTYRRFYNPIIEYIDEKNANYGSFYYGSGNNCLYWYCYDQLLVRKELVDKIKNFQYLKKIKNRNLIKNIKPNAKISDHLPLLVKINI